MKTQRDEAFQGNSTIAFQWQRPTQDIISLVRVYTGPDQDLMQIWSRGRLTGELTLSKGDWPEILRRLTTTSPREPPGMKLVP